MHESRTLQNYLNIIDNFGKQYGTDLILNNPRIIKFVYRGVKNIDYELIPGLFRNASDGNRKYLTLGKEIDIIQTFIQEAIAYITTIPETDYFRWIQIAQHYGVPTRLLDWTSNPLVAMYFACSGDFDKDGCVWILHRDNYHHYWQEKEQIKKHPEHLKVTIADVGKNLICKGEESDIYLPERPFLMTPYYIDSRMSTQASHFMIWGKSDKPFESFFENNNYLQMHKDKNGMILNSTEDKEEFVYKYIIPSSEKKEILRSLSRMGVNEKSIFPGLDGIGKYVESMYRIDDYTELLR